MSAKVKKKDSPSIQRNAEIESALRLLGRVFEQNGVEVRREKLCSGPAFNVKSGNCLFSGKSLIFIDKRLPVDQQLNLLFERLSDSQIDVSTEQLADMPEFVREFITARQRTTEPEFVGA